MRALFMSFPLPKDTLSKPSCFRQRVKPDLENPRPEDHVLGLLQISQQFDLFLRDGLREYEKQHDHNNMSGRRQPPKLTAGGFMSYAGL
jgi:hypothetical protein